MSKHTNMQRDVLVTNLEEQLETLASEKFGKALKECTDQETYYVLLEMTTRLMDVAEVYNGEKKVYYISMEFLIGKLLSNNLINLRVYDRVKEILEKNGKNLAAIEECEPEPSLGNGGLGRLAACFLDSIATLGMAGLPRSPDSRARRSTDCRRRRVRSSPCRSPYSEECAPRPPARRRRRLP